MMASFQMLSVVDWKCSARKGNSNKQSRYVLTAGGKSIRQRHQSQVCLVVGNKETTSERLPALFYRSSQGEYGLSGHRLPASLSRPVGFVVLKRWNTKDVWLRLGQICCT